MINFSNIINEFKEFILKRNAIDMALGIVLGVSFGKVVSSLVNDIITPPIGFLLGGVAFPHLKIILKKAVIQNHRIMSPEVSINYGSFIQSIIDFLIVAFSTFLIIKIINKLIFKNDKASVDWTEFIKK